MSFQCFPVTGICTCINACCFLKWDWPHYSVTLASRVLWMSSNVKRRWIDVENSYAMFESILLHVGLLHTLQENTVGSKHRVSVSIWQLSDYRPTLHITVRIYM